MEAHHNAGHQDGQAREQREVVVRPGQSGELGRLAGAEEREVPDWEDGADEEQGQRGALASPEPEPDRSHRQAEVAPSQEPGEEEGMLGDGPEP